MHLHLLIQILNQVWPPWRRFPGKRSVVWTKTKANATMTSVKTEINTLAFPENQHFESTRMKTGTYSRKCKEGHADHAERGSQQASVPRLRNLISITNGCESDLVKRWIQCER